MASKTSRSDDLNFATDKLIELEEKSRSIQAKWQEYNDQVGGKIKSILEEAGVWKRIHALEDRRNQVRAEAQKKIAALQKEAANLRAVKEFLESRSGKEDLDILEGEDDIDENLRRDMASVLPPEGEVPENVDQEDVPEPTF